MTQEQKAEAYSKAVEKAKQEYNTTTSEDRKQWLEELFPELKESEDEKIRKELIAHFRNTRCVTEEGAEGVAKWIAWLGKQGKPIDEEKVLMGARKDVALSIMNFLDRCTLGMCLSGLERADLESAVIDSDWSKVYDYMKKKLEKQGEKPQGKSALEAIKEVKVDNSNKVEPTFHEGDWVVYNNDVCQIVKREEGCNKLVTVFGIEKELVNERNLSTARLWTIKDAKPGDVLANDHHILILKELDYDWSFNGTPSAVKAYCGIKPNGNFEIGKDNWCFCGTLHIHPATKEQRAQLEKAMTDAGYTFDFEKKELRKIERKPAWSVSHVRTWLYIVSDVLTKHDGIGQYLDDGFCKKIAKYMQENWSKKLSLEQNSAWSEEDERMLVDCFNILHRSDYSIDKISKTVNWLKSLKDRYAKQE